MPYSCLNAPLFVPAAVGLPMLMGLRTTEQPCFYNAYYADYDKRLPPAPETLTRAEICSAARRREFDRVLHVHSLENIEVIDCGGHDSLGDG